MKDNIGQASTTVKILKENNFFIKKKYGQNFLVDQNVLANIALGAEITKDCDVIEIGPGLGSLTQHLASQANRVLCYEIDNDLIPILNKSLSDFSNIEVLHQDILKADINADIEKYLPNSKNIYMVANLPYYITTPIILKLLESTTKIKRYVMMMQDEVANRICSKPSVKDYNALSVAIQYRCVAKKIITVSANVFIPKPAVDSAVIRLDLYETQPFKAQNEDHFFKMVRECFAQRRKTLVNNLLAANVNKTNIYEILEKLNIAKDARSETLKVEDFVKLSDELTKL